MAFNATNILSKYSAAGNVAVLKGDFTALCSDMVALETFAATNATNAGKFSTFKLAEVTSVPATNIGLIHINTSSLASTDNGKWKQILLSSDRVGAPATNINLFDLNTAGLASFSTGQWKQLLLGGDKPGSSATNIGVRDLSQVTGVVSITTSYVNTVAAWTTIGSTPTTNPGDLTTTNAVPFFTTTTSIGTDSGQRAFYWIGLTNTSTSNANTALTIGVTCNIAAVQTSGVRVLMPVFTYFGTIGGTAGLTLNSTAKIYQISEF